MLVRVGSSLEEGGARVEKLKRGIKAYFAKLLGLCSKSMRSIFSAEVLRLIWQNRMAQVPSKQRWGSTKWSVINEKKKEKI